MGGTVVKSLSSSSWYCHQLRGVDSALSKATRSRSKQSSLMYIIGKYKCHCSNNCVTAASKKILRRSRLSRLRDDEWKLRPAAYVMYMCWELGQSGCGQTHICVHYGEALWLRSERRLRANWTRGSMHVTGAVLMCGFKGIGRPKAWEMLNAIIGA